MNVSELWKSEEENEWHAAKENYWKYVIPQNVALEKKIINIDRNAIRNMELLDFYNFLYDDYFRWKFTESRWLKTSREHFGKYAFEEKLEELSLIQKQLFTFDLNDIREGLKIASSIRGLATAGGSGLLAVLFPEHFGTVDQFIVKALQSIDDISESVRVSRVKPDNISIDDGVVIIKIMREKAAELNRIFGTSAWTPRAIDMVLWSSREASVSHSSSRVKISDSSQSIAKPATDIGGTSIYGISLTNRMSKEDKQQLKRYYGEYLSRKYNISTVETYFTDAIFLLNNSRSLELEFLDILLNDRDFSRYQKKLIEHFSSKGWEHGRANRQAKDYVKKLSRFREFIEEGI